MRSVAEHRAAVLSLVAPLPTVTVPLDAAVGSALAHDVVAGLALPPFDNSAMDGYAVRAADVSAVPTVLPVVEDVPAGHAPTAHKRGAAQRIMTGAPVPDGADAVIPVEWTDGGTITVECRRAVLVGANIRRAGEDVADGAVVLAAGDEVTPARAGLLAALGQASVAVHRRPRVAIVSTGSELVAPGRPRPPAAIYDANGHLLAAAATADGAEVTRCDPVPDDPSALRALLDALAGNVDLVVTSGGISAGAFEVVKETLAGHGVDLVTVAMQPGKPQGCGRFRGTPVITLPGNPVSASVSYELFVAPVIRRLAGHGELDRPTTRGRLAEAVTRKAGKTQYRRARCAGTGHVELVGGCGSHLLAALAHADVLTVIPAGDGECSAGTEVDVMRIGR